MAYDPTKPADGSLADAAELRSQFAGQQEQIDAKVTLAEVNTAIVEGTSGSVEGVAYLSLIVSNPPTQAQVQAIADKIDEMLMAQKRQ